MTTYKNRLLPSALMGYISPAPHKTGAGICPPLVITAHNRASGFFTCKASSRHFIRIMAGRMGQPQGWPGSVITGRANPVRLATPEFCPSDGELSKLITEVAPSWPTANSVARRLRASIRKPKSTAVSNAPIIWRSSCRPICYASHAAQCRYGCRQFWTTSPTISATFSDCLISPRAQRNKPPRRPCPSGAVVHPVNREVWL
ncbi:ash family protein [Salmonella enterica]|nr:ash family protein [Salmonella enterica]EGN6856739.1 ash family protein [Salmonella enterica]EHE1571005.1 ash family protein [Salmonella enterica]EJI3625440.1 ash family protein [Salmonella enterica]ELX3085004.1 ash family protein [Salmonella enterica]